MAKLEALLGKIKEARSHAKKVLVIDPLNTIAQKCYEKWKSVKSVSKGTAYWASSNDFLEESGKTKIVTLLNSGDEKVLATLDSGDEAHLVAYPHKVCVSTSDRKYVGKLPDDLAARLRNLIKSGSRYQVLIKSVNPTTVNVFIREVEKGESVKNITSFPPEKLDYVSFTPPELVHKDTVIPDVIEGLNEE